MINIATRAANLPQYLKATSQVVASGLKPVAAGVSVAKDPVVQGPVVPATSATLNAQLPKHVVSVKSGPVVTTQVRFSHTDLRVPDFSAYRRDSVSKPTKKSSTSVEDRNSFTYLVVGGSLVGSTYAAKALVTQFISSMSASADVLAMAKIEIKLSDIPEGKSATFKWRGKPLFIRHRTSEEISTEQSVAAATLRDPQADSERVQRPEWLVVIGVCTHLGCVPIANAGDFGGYYCPCHGSHYDASGRIRKGPAPLNLEVPAYTFPDDGTLIVG
ncbi:cytochrome b-c1 complex subunit Rieske, mitochondrial [Phlebotomus argentipes]|uniref:cytochrome b-c1 complex subunit Rieske, mitochondrial n=1 Tax=Phlebotomus argentipes TaxID=94469 RepID=UPI002892F657|nr:cytochrome b-c1 complex subunit Rieske, mitochondrial [Phlebotomus argentipes]